MGRQQAEAFAELGLEQGLKAHLLGNFYPRHDVRLVDVAIESIKIYNEHKYRKNYSNKHKSKKNNYPEK